MFDWIFKRNQRPDLAELKKMVEQPVIPKKYIESEEAKQLMLSLQTDAKSYIEKRDEDTKQKIIVVQKDTNKKYNDILKFEIAEAMKTHDQQIVLMVLGRMEGKFKEVAENGRKD